MSTKVKSKHKTANGTKPVLVAGLSRKQRRDKYADEMCREVRYQIANNFIDEQALFGILTKWMNVATKTKYVRP